MGSEMCIRDSLQPSTSVPRYRRDGEQCSPRSRTVGTSRMSAYGGTHVRLHPPTSAPRCHYCRDGEQCSPRSRAARDRCSGARGMMCAARAPQAGSARCTHARAARRTAPHGAETPSPCTDRAERNDHQRRERSQGHTMGTRHRDYRHEGFRRRRQAGPRFREVLLFVVVYVMYCMCACNGVRKKSSRGSPATTCTRVTR